MSLDLPAPIALFMFSENTHDLSAVSDCFAPEAVVRDEGGTRSGLKEIADWRRETSAKYHHTVEPVALTQRADGIVVTTKMTGSFPGSPITVDFVFQLKGNKIASLQIAP